ncbi:hypothetical protein L218DRAFT_40703 [Marasmius fiardii PR-910]|nr:hypothetical protein L218DRAFT_40703 [Marasmius fiardii PR-910]
MFHVKRFLALLVDKQFQNSNLSHSEESCHWDSRRRGENCDWHRISENHPCRNQSIQVYSIGFYADLNNPNLKLEPNMTAEQKVDHIIRTSACVLRIVPTRSTSYSHLRDAFMRALQGKLNLSRKSGTLSDDEVVEIALPLRKLKTLFPNTALGKHAQFDIFLSEPTPGKPRSLVFRDLGAIEHDWVATELVMHYFEGDGPSPPMKKAVTDRVQSL